MTIFYRPLPFLAAIAMAVGLYLQYVRPLDYPWYALLGAATVPAVALLMAYKRVHQADLAEKMLPTYLLILSVVFAVLLAEGHIYRIVLAVVGSLASLLSLELLFLYTFMPSRYPVNGLSRVNIAYVPLTVFFATSTSVGLMFFLHSSSILHVLGMLALGVALFRTTGHPDASREQNNRWMLVGAVTGLHLGLLGAMLPLSMEVQGTVAMLVFSGILRMRRYLYQPYPSKVQTWTEFAIATILLVSITVSSRWL